MWLFLLGAGRPSGCQCGLVSRLRLVEGEYLGSSVHEAGRRDAPGIVRGRVEAALHASILTCDMTSSEFDRYLPPWSNASWQRSASCNLYIRRADFQLLKSVRLNPRVKQVLSSESEQGSLLLPTHGLHCLFEGAVRCDFALDTSAPCNVRHCATHHVGEIPVPGRLHLWLITAATFLVLQDIIARPCTSRSSARRFP